MEVSEEERKIVWVGKLLHSFWTMASERERDAVS